MATKKSARLPLQRFAMVGAGIQGAQIAMIAARAGYDVTVYDPRAGAFRQTFEKIRADLKAKKVAPIIPWNQWEACAQKVRQVQELAAALEDAELVLEAVPENLELKKKVWREIGAKALPAAILATNSSSMPVSRFERAGGRPEQVLNIHFYFPLQGVNMVDIMGGTRTRA
ncbi:MAG: 3-hydroxyacyl-CoA dehydrogenase NAD-binding domain-containing protein, partial [Desulfobacterales bacterium]|nr:3-hydroxyacyl-CoA dehydrogenase NAD-binding domain-containing protein [Desulfobacterales bacterium]